MHNTAPQAVQRRAVVCYFSARSLNINFVIVVYAICSEYSLKNGHMALRKALKRQLTKKLEQFAIVMVVIARIAAIYGRSIALARWRHVLAYPM